MAEAARAALARVPAATPVPVPVLGRPGRGRDRNGGAAVYEEITVETVMAVQRKLNALGYSAGPVDGIFGPRTRAALQAYQWKMGLPADGVLSRGLAEMILSGT